jgi:hypothetical protein
MIRPGRLDRPVDHETDHVLGPADAEITLVEYGSYACPHCRAANERIAQARDQLGDRVRYPSGTGRSRTTDLHFGLPRSLSWRTRPRRSGPRASS